VLSDRVRSWLDEGAIEEVLGRELFVRVFVVGHDMGTSVTTELMARDLRDWSGPLTLAWGLHDPVARTEVLDGLRELRRGVETIELPDAGHYPQIEQPELISAALDTALAR
jgi:pimeloyl-ACP methyl ester carboxylesterase